MKKTVGDAAAGTTTQTLYVQRLVLLAPLNNPGGQVVCEYESDGVSTPRLSRRFAYGAYVDEPVWQEDRDAAGSVTRELILHRDSRYNVVGVTDDQTGALLATASYTAYGRRDVDITAQGTTAGLTATDLPYGFTGRRYDAESGLWYFRARMFSSNLGRFLSTDLLASARDQGPGGVKNRAAKRRARTIVESAIDRVRRNKYQYVEGMPTEYTDPSGHDRYWVGGSHPLDHSKICVDLYDENGCKTGSQYCCQMSNDPEGSAGSQNSGSCGSAAVGGKSIGYQLSFGLASVGLWCHRSSISCGTWQLDDEDKSTPTPGTQEEDEELLRQLKSESGTRTYWHGTFNNCHTYANSRRYVGYNGFLVKWSDAEEGEGCQ